jgi:hypothetical protein
MTERPNFGRTRIIVAEIGAVLLPIVILVNLFLACSAMSWANFLSPVDFARTAGAWVVRSAAGWPHWRSPIGRPNVPRIAQSSAPQSSAFCPPRSIMSSAS